MEDIFAVDDYHVDIASRPRVEEESFRAEDYAAQPRLSNNVQQQQQPTDGPHEDEFSFDYLPARRAISPDAPFDLGLDDEVIVKKRVPKAKLDEERLLGPEGIPKLRDEVAKKIKFRGKGHEIQDLGRFIEHYQFWAHSLFPKAKFRDALKMMGRVGKTKSMKMHRRRLITELLPRPEYMDEPNSDESDVDISHPRPSIVLQDKIADRTSDQQDLFVRDDDEFDLSDFESNALHAATSSRPAQGFQGIANDIPDEMPMDEMDDADDMDALEAMGFQV